VVGGWAARRAKRGRNWGGEGEGEGQWWKTDGGGGRGGDETGREGHLGQSHGRRVG
jgi:hypothetical protein